MSRLVLARWRNLGGWGGGASLACAVHCALMPLLVPLLPWLGAGWLADERSEIALLTASLVLSGFGIGRGWSSHRRPAALGLFVASAGMLGFARLGVGMNFAEILTLAGTFSLLAANLVNHRLLCHCERCAADVPSPRSTDEA